MKRANIFWLALSLIVILTMPFVSACTSDAAPPSVVSTYPDCNAQNIAINSTITVTFNESVDPSTITTATFTLKDGTTLVPGTVTSSGTTATFTPSSLARCKTYTLTITTGVKDRAGNALASAYTCNFSTSCPEAYRPGAGVTNEAIVGGRTSGDEDKRRILMPQVVSTSPANVAAPCVPITASINATFNKAMIASTINTQTFTLTRGATPVAGVVTYAGLTATFTPLVNLLPSTAYTATITNGARDMEGNYLATYIWNFNTCPDITAPTVLLTAPLPGVCLPNNSSVSATFSEPMNQASVLSSFTLTQAGVPVAGTVGYAGVTMIFTPTVPFVGALPYVATISTGAMDLAGNHLAAPRVWTFNTCGVPDAGAPTVVSTSPIAGALCVPLDGNITATFSELMNPVTILAPGTFTVTRTPGATPVAGTLSYAGLVATFNPDVDLPFPFVYTVTITTAATDLAGNPLAANFVWTFTTCGPAGPAPIFLGSLACPNVVSVVAGSTIINTGITTVTGDVDLSPGSAVVGFPPGIVGPPGAIHINDGVANLAQVDLTAAYNEAAGRTPPTIIVADLGGTTLPPGIYKSPSAIAITAGNLILDAQGNANATWIFQAVSTLTLGANRQIILANGALANRVFWQVGSSATLGTNSVLNGRVMADQSITVQTGGRVNGSVWARIGAVNLDSNIINTICP